MEAIRAEAPADDLRTRAAALPRSIWRRRADTSLATLSGGIRLAVFTSPFIVRWVAWGVALLILLITNVPHENHVFEPYLLIGTFVQTAVVTFYVPVIRPLMLPALRRRIDLSENADVLMLGLIDLALSMTAVYLSGGWGSPYYHFALTALLIPSFFLTFRSVLVLAAAYTAAYIGGLAVFGEGVHGSWRDSNLNSFIGAVVTPVLVALVPNYLGSVLRDLDVARQDAVDALADSDLLYRIARAFLEGGRDLDDAMPRVASEAVESSRFDAIVLLVPDDLGGGGETRAVGREKSQAITGDAESGRGEAERASPFVEFVAPEPATLSDAFGDSSARTAVISTLPAPLGKALGMYDWAGVVALRSADGVEGWLIAVARDRPTAIQHETKLLDAIAGQIALGVRNIRLSAQIAEFAAEGERTRIAREIHDGIAQMVFMLTLSLETAIDRVGTDPDEQRRRLRDLTTLAKNALWEVRQYIFDLRPLLAGDEGLIGAIDGQVKEFQAVSELPVELRVNGAAPRLPLATSAAMYRIVQEGLGNIFRHARASSVQVTMDFRPECVALTIADDGIGIGEAEAGARIGHGMENLRRRVEDMHGTLVVHSEAGAGTRIEVTVPIDGGEG